MNSKNKETHNNNLRSIRKAKELTVDEVANTLKLTADTIRKLEDNDFESLGAYTYIRGYLINYSRLLNVDAEQYLSLIPKSQTEVSLINTSSTLTKGIKLTRQSKNIASYTFGTFIVLAMGFSGWYLLQNYTKTAKNNEILLIENNQLEIKPQQPSLDTLNLEEVELTEQTESFHYSSLIPTNENNEKSPNEINLPEQVDTSSVNLSNSEETTETIANEVKYLITIEATETSWVKVEQLDGTKLHNDLLQPSIITLESNSPVHFRIGNEKMVKVTVNGKPVDISQHARKRIADFNWPLDS